MFAICDLIDLSLPPPPPPPYPPPPSPPPVSLYPSVTPDAPTSDSSTYALPVPLDYALIRNEPQPHTYAKKQINPMEVEPDEPNRICNVKFTDLEQQLREETVARRDEIKKINESIDEKFLDLSKQLILMRQSFNQRLFDLEMMHSGKKNNCKCDWDENENTINDKDWTGNRQLQSTKSPKTMHTNDGSVKCSCKTNCSRNVCTCRRLGFTCGYECNCIKCRNQPA